MAHAERRHFPAAFAAALGCVVATTLTAPAAPPLPAGYDVPASDQGGPRLGGGLQWIQGVCPRAIVFADTPAWPQPTVMFITNYGGVDTVHELCRRFPMDVLHFWGNDMGDRARFNELLGSRDRIDCFVLSRFKTKSMPADIQYDILKRVSEGAGFVMIDDFDRSETLTPRFLELKPTASGKRVFPGIPYDGLRQWSHADVLDLPIMNYWNTRSLPQAVEVKPYEYSSTSISTFGKGVAIWIETGTHWLRAGRSGRTLLPQINLRRDMWVEDDYAYSHTAKAIMRAARMPQAARILEVALNGAPALRIEGAEAFPATVRWQVRDTWGAVGEHGTFACRITTGAQTVALQDLRLLDAGRRFVDVWLLRAAAVVDWGSGFRLVDRDVRACTLVAAHPEGTARGQPLTGTVTVPDVPAGTRLRLSLWDRHWREVARTEHRVATDGHVPFRFATAGLDGQIWNVHADLLAADGQVLSRAFLTVTSPHTRATRGGFHPLMTCVDATNPEEAARAEYLRQLGFLANRPYSGGNRILAESMAWRDLQLHPFSFRITGASDDVNHDYITDWSGPGVQRDLVEVHRLMTRLYKPFGLRGYNLSDDSSPSSQLPLGPYTTVAFHRWLEQEYGGLMETVAAWGMKTTGFGRIHSWGRIHQKSVKAWYDKGMTAPWIDAQRFLEKHWVDTMVLVRDAVRSVLPDANVGSDASYYKHAMSDLFGRLDYIAPYYRDVAVKVAVARGAARRAGDYGACLGSYGDKPERMTGRRSQIWDVLFAGGTALYYWSFHVGLREDLSLHDAHALYQCEVVEEVMNGIGELFTQAQRVFDPVAILDSQTSGICNQLEQEGEPLTSKANSLAAFLHALEDLGLNAHIITAAELADGRLEGHGMRVLLLPGCISLSAAEIAAIEAFAKGGGTVVADTRPGVRLPNGTLRTSPPLDAVFGVRLDRKQKTVRSKGLLVGTAFGREGELDFGLTLADPRVVAAGASAFAELRPPTPVAEGFTAASAVFSHDIGDGRAVLFNASFSSYDTLRGEGGEIWEPWHRVMDAIAAAAGITPALRGTSRGRKTPGLEFSPFRHGDGWLLGVEDLGCGDDTAERRPFEVQLPAAFHLYDIRAGRYLRHASILEDSLPRGGHRAYALLPYKATGIEASLESASVSAGGLVRLTVRLLSDGPLFTGHVVRVTAQAPGADGLFFPFKRVLRLPQSGEIALPLQLAYNDPVGTWQIAVTDVSTGVSTTVGLEVKGGAR